MTLDTYDSPEAEALLRAGEERLAPRPQPRRERFASAIGAASFLVSATLLALLAPWTRAFSVANLILVLGVWVEVERVKFPVASGWTYPTMLAFVPMLFILPP